MCCACIYCKSYVCYSYHTFVTHITLTIHNCIPSWIVNVILFLYFLLVANCSYLPQTRPTVRQLVLRGGFRTIANSFKFLFILVFFLIISCTKGRIQNICKFCYVFLFLFNRNNTNNTKGKIENNPALVENIQTF